MKNVNQTVQIFKTLQVVYALMCISLSLLLVVTFMPKYANVNTHIDVQEGEAPILTVALMFTLTAPVMAKYVYGKILRGLDFSFPVDQKLMQYRSGCIARYAFLYVVGLFNVAIWFVTGNLIFVILTIVIILYMIIIRPLKNKAIGKLKISNKQVFDKQANA